MTEEKCDKCQDDEIKDEYKKLQEKYSLPTFEEINEDFDVLKSDCELETILRDIRKIMVSKFSSWLNFIELLLNPSNGSMFHLYLVKGITSDEKEVLKNLFEKIGEIEIDAFGLEIDYDEEKEAKFVKENFKSWQEMKEDLKKINDSLKENWKKVVNKKEKSYFG